MSPEASHPHSDYDYAVEVAARELGIVVHRDAQDGLAEYCTNHPPSVFAGFFIQHFARLNPCFMASALDAAFDSANHIDRRLDDAELDLLREAIVLGSNESWACAVIERNIEPTGDYPNEVSISNLITSAVDAAQIRANAARITKPD